ncbi:hypothetical protein [Chamaesiphon polymorphus]|nr:hypothetical protein [Chamaesiphon polymorphus]
MAVGSNDPTKLLASTLVCLILLDDFYPGDTFIGMPESAMRTYTERLEKREQAGFKKL